tara:strand:+ start:1869 stop:2228 length:360 start_codon:yes stop_codon:yes gene_type:complete
MSTLANNFTNFLSEVEQMEKDNEKLTEDIRQLEKQKAEGWRKFNTDTHILMDREELDNLVDRINDIDYNISDIESYAEDTYSAAESASNYAYDAKREVSRLKTDLKDMISPAKEEEVAE